MNRIQFVGNMFQGAPLASIVAPNGQRKLIEAIARVSHLADMPQVGEVFFNKHKIASIPNR